MPLEPAARAIARGESPPLLAAWAGVAEVVVADAMKKALEELESGGAKSKGGKKR